MKVMFFFAIFSLFLVASHTKEVASQDTKACIECHEMVSPGIVSDFKASKHYKSGLVGCAECHSGKDRPDSFSHNGFRIHTVVSPTDCAKCHVSEVIQYKNNIMSHAYGNLTHNDLFKTFMKAVNYFEGRPLTEEDSCLSCHGTKLEVRGTKKRDTVLGVMEFVALEGWPNTGVGRINPDGSKGSCSACHARHSFSLRVARSPETCSRCHKGPDVPAYKIYSVSKHGILYGSQKEKWNLESKPWIIGKDYNAPTCATCHIAEVSVNGEIIAKRTHTMSDRLSHRLFGIPYATAYPKSPETYKVKNKEGLPILSELTGEPVAEYLIDKEEQARRTKTMKSICSVCHTTSFVERHFLRVDEAIVTTNDIIRESTKLLTLSWNKGGANIKDGIFNELIERLWIEQWLFYGNSIRLASAMGGTDYGVFDGGRWSLSSTLEKMKEWLRILFFLTNSQKTAN